jgi:DNA-binding Xre family transcriptional regulator
VPDLDAQIRTETIRTRRAKHLTQQRLAELIGVTQSQISDFETGKRPTLSHEKIQQLCQVLGIRHPDSTGLVPQNVGGATACCPDAWCPGAVIRALPQHIKVRPLFLVAYSGPNCPLCGEVLAKECEQCGAPVEFGVCCPQCGKDYAEPPGEWGNLEADQLDRMNQANERFMQQLSTGRAVFVRSGSSQLL